MSAAGLALLLLGLLQMAADLAGLPALRALAAATQASPAPKVFSAVHGLETYSTRFTVEWHDEAGRPHSLVLSPEVYARLNGPYNRRNVYGAALAYGPILATNERTRLMWEAVARHALCGQAPLLRELGAAEPPRPGSVRVRLTPLPGTDLGGLPAVLAPPCP
ncbi:MAG: hypothetical protein ACREK6_02435 [Candidatus Rokuibacteriota bacterium]